MWLQGILRNRRRKIRDTSGKVYYLEWTDVPEMLFTLHHLGQSCRNVPEVVVAPYVITEQSDPRVLLFNSASQQWSFKLHCCAINPHPGRAVFLSPVGKTLQTDRQTYICEPERCSTLSLERVEYVERHSVCR
jgi:hypothetical protein